MYHIFNIYITLRSKLLLRFISRLQPKNPRALSDPFKNTRVLNVVKLQLFYKLDTCKAKRLKATPRQHALSDHYAVRPELHSNPRPKKKKSCDTT